MNIEEKTKLAHEWFMEMVSAKAPATVATAWKYADQMEAEAEKRIKAEVEKDAEESKVFFEKLNSAHSSQLEQVLHDIDCYFDKTDNTQRDANNLIQSVYERLSGEVLNPSNSMELEWQPDWSIAPSWAEYFAVDENTEGWFFNREPHIDVDGCWYCGDNSYEVGSHDYQGDWKDSLRKRP